MKKEFSTSWLSSKQVRKQRKHRANAPLHTRHKFLRAHLSKELSKKYGRSLAIKKGDEVMVMRGAFAKKKAKVSSVDMKRSRVSLEGITRQKKDGSKISIYFNPSKLLIQSLNTDDKRRLTVREQNKEEKNAPNKS